MLDCTDSHIVRYTYMVVVIHEHGHSLATGEIIRLLNCVYEYEREATSPKLSTVGTYSNWPPFFARGGYGNDCF